MILMRNKVAVMIGMLVMFIASISFGYDPPKPSGYVVDVASKLSAQQLYNLNSKLSELNKSTKNEFAALIIPSLNGNSIEDVAQDTFKSWGIGKAGLDNGVLVVIAVAERKSRIQTGKGVEGDLTDLQCNDILRNTLAPYLKKGDFYGGLNATFNSISSAVKSRSAEVVPPMNNIPTEPISTPLPTPSKDSSGWIWATFLIPIGTLFFVLFSRVNKKKAKFDAAVRSYNDGAPTIKSPEPVKSPYRNDDLSFRTEKQKLVDNAIKSNMKRFGRSISPPSYEVDSPNVSRLEADRNGFSKSYNSPVKYTPAIKPYASTKPYSPVKPIAPKYVAPKTEYVPVPVYIPAPVRPSYESDSSSSYGSSSSSSSSYDSSPSPSPSYGGGDSGGGGSSSDW